MTPEGEALWGESGLRITEASEFDKYNPKVCVDNEGGIYVAWISETDLYYNLFMQHIDEDGNTLWDEEDTRITNNEFSYGLEALIPDGNGGAVLLWVIDGGDGVDNIWIERINENGERLWGEEGSGLVVCNTRLRQSDPRIMQHQEGFVVVWVDGRDDENRGVQLDIFGQFINPDGSFRWRENGSAICGEEHHQVSPSIAVDNEDNIWVALVDHRYEGGPRRRDIYIQKVSPEATDEWQVHTLLDDRNGVGVCTANSDQQYPCLVYDGHIGMWVIWDDRRRSTSSNIYATHLNTNGEPLDGWGENGQVVCDAYRMQDYPQAALIRRYGDTGIVVAWIDERATYYDVSSDIYAQRIDDDLVSVRQEKPEAIPTGYILEEAYPNPFNSQTLISYTAKIDGHVKIGLFDVTGRFIRQLSSERTSAGRHQIWLNAENLPAGSYMIKLEAGDVELERKITLIK
ncbi:MAG: T9SS type A sorting domain-containing protein [Candidatus Hatepunaea meridiana]|nr:T9SS type A sorting domain-containing protein [Candidatus Hatepunaea meridiana]